ncbi:pyrroline-5-carboxylate reductase, partial [Lecanoromycetidae sp. Uapishka_2]
MAHQIQNKSITFLGCGKLSSAILDGILSSLTEPTSTFAYPPSHGGAKSGEAVTIVPESFIACVKQQHSADALRQKYSGKVEVLTNRNVLGVSEGEIIILGVEPKVYEEVLTEPGMRTALSGKILVSILGGVSTKMLADAIYGQSPLTNEEKENKKQCEIIRVLPSTAAAVRDSPSLIIEEAKDQYPSHVLSSVTSLFKRVGSIKLWPNDLGPVGATLSASSNAFFTLPLEGAVDAAVKLGVDRKDALQMAAAAMRGAANLIASGEEPSEVRRKVATPGGSTAVGLKFLEDGNMRALMEEAILKTVEKAGGLGQKKGAD